MPAGNKLSQSPFQSAISAVLESGVCLIILFGCLGTLPPGVNESHYLPKAKHIWDPGFASGGDLFLESGNSHWLASAAAGSAARFFELTSVAWIGRLASWWLLSLAWVRLCHALAIPRAYRPLGLLAWILWNLYGHWAGEWFVGGFEAKSIAYPCILFGIAAVVRDRWSLAWFWLGLAVAWHPVVGGWAGLSVLSVWLFAPGRYSRLIEQWPAICLGLAIGLIGLLPALWGLGGSDREGNISAAQVHTYYRLAHHLSPQTFSSARHVSAGIALGILAVISLLVKRRLLVLSTAGATRQLMMIAWSAVFISFTGLALDASTMLGVRQDLIARILRFYFFRWSDVAVPLVVTIFLMHAISSTSQSCNPVSLEAESRFRTFRGNILAVPFIIVLTCLGVLHWSQIKSMSVPPADELMMKSVGPLPVHWGDLTSDATAEPSDGGRGLSNWLASKPAPQRWRDWLAVCDWIQENTPIDSLWLTPRSQQTFKWYAGRAEVVNWKDVPQDNASIIEWYRRVERCKQPRTSQGIPRGWNTEELLELARQYQCQWILVDRTYQESPPLLECKYPLHLENRSFAVFYVSPVALAKQPVAEHYRPRVSNNMRPQLHCREVLP